MNLIETKNERLRLVRECERWIGTPFVIRAKTPGVGVDCVRLVGEILRRNGWRADITRLPDYQETAPTVRCATSTLRDWLESCRLVELLGGHESPDCGDILTFRIGSVEHHAGLAVDPARFIHAMAGTAVRWSSLTDPTYQKRLVAVWRPLRQPRSDVVWREN